MYYNAVQAIIWTDRRGIR